MPYFTRGYEKLLLALSSHSKIHIIKIAGLVSWIVVRYESSLFLAPK